MTTAAASLGTSGYPTELETAYSWLGQEPQEKLAKFNERRLRPRLCSANPTEDLDAEFELRRLEEGFIASERSLVAPLLADVPTEPDAFLSWFQGLCHNGPGQADPLFPWLASSATISQIRWFLTQEVAGEAGFDDLVALTQLKMPTQIKLELGRNFWDELGRGVEAGMHGPMLKRVADSLGLESSSMPIPEALALANLLTALAANRQYAYQSVGALGVIELTAPTRAPHVNRALKRVGVDAHTRQYFALHATLDVQHSIAWNREVIQPLVQSNPEVALAIAEGALLRLAAGARCFRRYRQEFQLDT